MPVEQYRHCALVLLRDYNIFMVRMLDLGLLSKSKTFFLLILEYFYKRIASEPCEISID